MFIQSLGEVALGTRLKLLSDRLYNAVDEIYQQRELGVESRWAVYLLLLKERGPLSTTEIAGALGTSHPSVSQLAPKLEASGLITRGRDLHDDRRTLLSLTPEGERRVKQIGPVLEAIRDSVSAAIERTGFDLLGALAEFERQLDARPLSRDVLQRHARHAPEQVQIVPFRPELREHFYRLNVAWVNKDFVLEPADQRVLSHPEREVLDHGGRIFFAQLGQQVIGTCGLEREAPGVYAVIKMTVDETYRGLGVGRALLARVVEEFKKLRGRELFLETNSKLTPALKLYESSGFVRQRKLRSGSPWARADVYMIYQPPKARSAKRIEPKPRAARRRRGTLD